MPSPAADGRAERHDSGRTGVNQTLRDDDVVGGVGKHGEAFLHEDAGGFDGGLDVGIERGLIADDFDLYPVGEADFTCRDAPCEWLRPLCSSRPCSAAGSSVSDR